MGSVKKKFTEKLCEYNFKFYNFADGKIRKNKCVARSLEYFGIVYDKNKDKNTLQDFINALIDNDIDYEILFFNEDTFRTTKGFLIFQQVATRIGHVACYENGLYIDSYDLIYYEKLLPTYMVVIKEEKE